jgi:hypothetical protein
VASAIPGDLMAIANGRYIRMEDEPDRVAGELLAFLELRMVTEEAG